MRRFVVLVLAFVLFVGAIVDLYAESLIGNLTVSVQTESSSYPSNFIDHLPFTINTSDVYYITKDLSVSGTGITILADNVVLLGQGHTITGNISYPGSGIYIGMDIKNIVKEYCYIELQH